MLVSRLLLVQISAVLASGTFSEKGGFAPSNGNERGGGLNVSLPEATLTYPSTSMPSEKGRKSIDEAAEEFEALLESVAKTVSLEEQKELACMELKKTAQELELLLPGQGGPEALCRLLWNPERVVNVNMAKIVEYNLRFDEYVLTALIEDGKAGQMLVLPKGVNGLPLSLQINNSRYTLTHVIARCTFQHDKLVFCSSFDVDKSDRTIDNIGDLPWFKTETMCFAGSTLTRSIYKLLSRVEAPEGEFLFEYDYGIYRYDGFLQTPFDIKHLRYLRDEFVLDEMMEIFNYDLDNVDFVSQAVHLVGFIQLWDAVQEEGNHFKNDKLEEMRVMLRGLKGIDAKKEEKAKTRGVLEKACEFLQPHIDGHFSCAHPFLSVLKAEEPTMWNARFLGENNPFYDESKSDGRMSDGPLEELFFYFPSKDSKEKNLPRFTATTFAGDEATLELLAMLDKDDGNMYVVGTDYDALHDDEIFQMALYSDDSYIEIVNTPLRGELSSFTGIDPLLLYIYRFAKRKRFTSTKRAAK